MSQPERRSGTDRRVKRFWHRWKHTVAYLALAAALFFVSFRGEDSRNDFESVVVRSGNYALTVGCNSDFRTAQRFRFGYERSLAAIDRQLENKQISKATYKDLKSTYEQQIADNPLPDCRDIQIVTTPDQVLVKPLPLFPGSEWENKALPGEKFTVPEPAPNKP